MSTELKMPRLSDNMEKGTIVRWFKKPGEAVREGEPLAEVETDKADVELEAEAAGVVRELRVGEGESVPVGAVIAVLGAPGEAVPATPPAEPERPAAAIPAPARIESPAPSAPRPAPATRETAAGGRPPRVSPLADRLATELGVNPRGLVGSGPGGRVLRRDVEAAGGRQSPTSQPPAAAVRSPAAPGSVAPRAESPAIESGRDASGVRLEEPSKIRQAIAQYMSEAKQRVPHFYVTAEIDMGELMRLRQALRDSGRFPDLTVTHLLLAALARTLPKHPRVNASWRDGKFELHDEVNLGVAVGVEDGLLVPVLRGAQRLSLEEIARRTTELTARARQGKFGTEDLRGATFTLSNLGMFDIEEFSAIINPPQAAILAVGAVKERAVVRDGELTVAKTMKATLSCDHRVLNGTEGARFLVDLKGLLQSPIPLVLP